jgi:hypothetical protein
MQVLSGEHVVGRGVLFQDLFQLFNFNLGTRRLDRSGLQVSITSELVELDVYEKIV